MGQNKAALEAAAVEGLRALITLLGDNPDAPVLARTPTSMIKALRVIGDRPPITPERLLTPAPVLGMSGEPAESPYRDASARVLVGPTPFRSICETHMMPFGGLVYVAHDPGPDGYQHPHERHRGRILRVPGGAFAALADWYTGSLTSPDRITVNTSQIIKQVVGGAGALCAVRLLEPCPMPHPAARRISVPGTAYTAGWGVYDLTGSGRLNRTRRAEVDAFVSLEHPAATGASTPAATALGVGGRLVVEVDGEPTRYLTVAGGVPAGRDR